MNNDPEIKQLIKLMGTIACFEILRSKDLITDEELEKLKKSVISDYDVDALTKYFNKKHQKLNKLVNFNSLIYIKLLIYDILSILLGY